MALFAVRLISGVTYFLLENIGALEKQVQP